MNQNKIIKNSGMVIPKSIGADQISYIKDFLTRITPSYQNSPSIRLTFYLENDEAIKVPRYFPIEKFIDTEVIDITKEGLDINIKHNITLRDDLQKNVVNYMLTNTKGIIQAAPGSGKTVIGVFVISELRKKTIILCHRESLCEQWLGPGTEEKRQGFLGHTDISPDEIGRLSSSNFKECLKKSIIVSTTQTFLSLLKRNRDEFLLELKNSGIGIIISDECHVVTGAPTFSECSLHIPAYRTFGLSATPSRSDGTEDVMEYHLGSVWSPEGSASVMSGRVVVLLFNSEMLPKSYGYIYWGGMFQRSRYLSLLKKSKIFMNICEALLNKFYSEGRDILFVGERIKLLEELFKKIKCNDKGLFVGSAKLDKIENKVTFSTPGKCRDGIDLVSKNLLIMSSPISNVEQMTGRVLRIKEGKLEPIIIDFVDLAFHEISNSFHGRLKFYLSRGWNVKYILLSSDGVKKEISYDDLKMFLK